MNSPNRLDYAFFALSLVITKSASAQVAERKALTLEGAKKVIAAAEAYASGTMLRRCHRRRGRRWQPDRLIAPRRHFPAVANISIGKARTAVMFHRTN